MNGIAHVAARAHQLEPAAVSFRKHAPERDDGGCPVVEPHEHGRAVGVRRRQEGIDIDRVYAEIPPE